MNAADVMISGFGMACITLIVYLGYQLYKQKADNAIKTISLKDAEIEKTVDALTLQQLVDDNNKKSGTDK